MERTTVRSVGRPRERRDRGFTLLELLVALGVIMVASAVAVPVMIEAARQYRLGMAIRDVERELQTARSNAVTSNRPIRVRFNCPADGQYRRVELIGEPWLPVGADTPASRCDGNTYRYPAPDADPSTRPNHDGPVRLLPRGTQFQLPRAIEFRPDGTARVDSGVSSGIYSTIPSTGVTVAVTNGTKSRTIIINGLGRVHLQPAQ